ncbi:MAG: sugar ABC transporter ATP-binding protein [Clostridiales bacterium]|nr:sugar ABC transporter ATP-binding protein [Clostridiales bacterium]
MPNDIVLEMRGICKAFPGVRALQDVDFTLRRGEIHALMGENGAGKSTLIKTLTGVYQKDSGQIDIEGRRTAFRSPHEAQANGVGTVYQEIMLCPNLSVAENMFIGREKGVFVSWREMNRRAGIILDGLSIPARPTQQLRSCSLAVQQMIAIARAVDMQCKILILDEPTSSLDEDEVQKLFALMRELKERGVGIIFVTHFLDQVYQVSDRITVLRNGELVGEYEAEKLPQVELVSKMMGKELGDVEKLKNLKEAAEDGGTPVFEAESLSSAAGVRPYDFHIQKGEVNGFTGLLGSGRSESVRAIFAADKVTGGNVRINGKRIRIRKPKDAMKRGIGYLPEDRKGDGLIADLSVRENIVLALQTMHGFFRPFSLKKARAFADEYIALLNIKTPSSDTPVHSLSGGNQQKVILARWLLIHPEYLILDEPTRGIDVGTKVEIQRLVLKLASEGVSVTFISSEIEEMLRTCSRLIVMRDRNIVGELSGEDMTQSKIMHTIAGEVTQNA